MSWFLKIIINFNSKISNNYNFIFFKKNRSYCLNIERMNNVGGTVDKASSWGLEAVGISNKVSIQIEFIFEF